MNTKGKVLYLGGFELPDKNAAAHRVIANGKVLKDLNCDVVFCGITKSDTSIQVLETKKTFFGFSCYSILHPKSVFKWLKYIIAIANYKKIVASEGDVKAIICYNLPAISLYRLYKFCRKNHILIIADCTEWYASSKADNLIRQIVKSFDTTFRMKYVHFKMDAIITISSYLKDYYKTKKSLIIEIPPLIDKQDAKWDLPVSTPGDVLQLAYSGQPGMKGNVKDRLDIIIEALFDLAQKDKRIQLHVVGVTKDQFLTTFRYLNSNLDFLGKFVIFYGRVTHYESISILNKSDFSIFLRDQNQVTKAGFPTKFVEAISLGIPVLTSDNSNVKDYLIDNKNGYLVSIENVKETLEVVYKLQPDEIIKMKQYCKETNPFHYSNFKSEFSKLFIPS